MGEVSKKEVTTIGNGYHYTNMYADHPKEYLPGNKKTSQTPPNQTSAFSHYRYTVRLLPINLPGRGEGSDKDIISIENKEALKSTALKSTTQRLRGKS